MPRLENCSSQVRTEVGKDHGATAANTMVAVHEDAAARHVRTVDELDRLREDGEQILAWQICQLDIEVSPRRCCLRVAWRGSERSSVRP